MRQSRKLEHIKYALELADGPLPTGLSDIRLVHNAIPELNLEDVELHVQVFERSLEAPLLINAITGGNPGVLEINRLLARAACAAGVGMAVGSQTGALLDPELAGSFAVVRQENPAGLVIANVGAMVSPALALQAVEMVEANALQVHLNVAQELAMAEGDREFRGALENIAKLVETSPVPVIVKEVGFGVSGEAAKVLQGLGVTWIDIGGAGGTNFVSIEHRRKTVSPVPEDWGIPSAASLAEVTAMCPGCNIIASGGLRTPQDAVKSLAIGASLVGIAGLWLKILLQQSYTGLVAELDSFKAGLRCLMLLLGARTVPELRRVPLVIAGSTGEWLRQRGVETGQWSRR